MVRVCVRVPSHHGSGGESTDETRLDLCSRDMGGSPWQHRLGHRAEKSGESGVCCLRIVLSRTWPSVEKLAVQLSPVDAYIQFTYITGQSLEQASSVHEFSVIGVVNSV